MGRPLVRFLQSQWTSYAGDAKPIQSAVASNAADVGSEKTSDYNQNNCNSVKNQTIPIVEVMKPVFF